MTSKLPVKIEPERLKDTIVELRYHSQVAYEYRLGLCHKVLTDHGFSVFIPSSPNPAETNPAHFFLAVSPKHIFQNDVIRVYYEEGKVVINSNGQYRGWKRYSESVLILADLLRRENLLGEIYWVGLRYISEFSEVQIFDQLTWQFNFPVDNSQTINTSFRTEWIDDSDHIVVNLLNNGQRGGTSFSLMDVDVNHNCLDKPIELPEQLADVLNRIHEKEKLVFFGLMNEEFLQSLNPTYV